MKAFKKHGLYVLVGNALCYNVIASNFQHNVTMLWHRRLGHISFKGLHILHRNKCAENVKLNNFEFCEHCIIGKKNGVKFQATKYTTKCIIDYVHFDL